MRVLGLDGREYKLSLADRVAAPGDSRARSAGHLLCRKLLREVFPFDAVCEEVTLPGCGDPLYLDFLLPSRRLAFEIQGRQHYEYVPFFHGSRAGYAKAQARDKKKAEFLRLNGITLVTLDDSDTAAWAAAVRSAFVAG